MSNKLVRVICYCLYYGFTRHLPEDNAPGGRLWGKLRAWTARPLFRSCGRDLKVNRGAKFGFGNTISIGNNSGIGAYARLVGEIIIGNDCGMAFDVFITASNRDFQRTDIPIVSQGIRPDDPVVLEDGVALIAKTIVLPGVRIGEGTFVAAGAVISKNVPKWSIVAGNPARVVKWRREPDKDAFGPDMTPVKSDKLKRHFD